MRSQRELEAKAELAQRLVQEERAAERRFRQSFGVQGLPLGPMAPHVSGQGRRGRRAFWLGSVGRGRGGGIPPGVQGTFFFGPKTPHGRRGVWTNGTLMTHGKDVGAGILGEGRQGGAFGPMTV